MPLRSGPAVSHASKILNIHGIEFLTDQRSRHFQRQRRIKCDETKPVCKRCAVSDRECAGYQVPKALVFGLVNDKEEQWSFYYFRDRTSAEILTFMDHRFWNTLVIQAGHVRPIVRHALMAIGSWHEAVDHENDARRRDRQQFALQQYNKAIGCALKADGQGEIDELLLAIILFAFFDNIRGEWATALTHLQSGRRIMSNANKTARQVESSRSWSSTVQRHVAPIFDSVHQAVACSMPLLSRCLPSDGVALPSKLKSLRDARYHLHEILHTVSEKLDDTYEHFPWPTSDTKTILEGRQVLGQWHDKFQTYLSQAKRHCLCSGTSSTCHFELGMYHIQMQYLFGRLRLECEPFREEMSFDALNHRFEELVPIGELFLQAMGRLDAVGAQQCIGFGVDYIGVMSMVALRCRDPRIRREAGDVVRRGYAVTKHPAHLYVPELCGYVTQLEEMKATVPSPQHCSQIPNTARVHIVSSNLFIWDEANQVYDM